MRACQATEITLAAHGVDLVVIGSNAACAGRRPGLARGLRWLLRHVPRPILTIPESYPRQGMVLIAYDGSTSAARALYAFENSGLAEQDEVRLLVVHKAPGMVAMQTAQAREFLRAHSRRLGTGPAAVDAPAPTTQTLLQMAAASDVRLLVLGGTGAFPRLGLFGRSTARAVLRSSPVPVFLFR